MEKIKTAIIKQPMPVFGGIIIGAMLVNIYIGVFDDKMTSMIVIQSLLMTMTVLLLIFNSSKRSEKCRKDKG